MTTALHRYTSPEEDSARWEHFPFRDGDVVISTRSKCGTTWMQMICAMLALGTADLPEPLGRLSPWLDHLLTPLPEVLDRLTAQPHRRVIKTHTPLDGVPLDARATYVVVGRHPLDMAVSLYHQGGNLDRARIRQLTGEPDPPRPPPPVAPLAAWLTGWVDGEADAREHLDSLPGVALHYGDAWRRRDEPNVLLVHYDDLLADLEGQMRRLAVRLGAQVPDNAWPRLVQAATFERMRSRAADLVPDARVLRDPGAFFRLGRSGAGREVLDDDAVARYQARIRELASPDLVAWLNHR